MLRLTRQVRFAVNAVAGDPLAGPAPNSYGGFPSLNGFGRYFELSVTVGGAVEQDQAFLINIKEIDQAVRHRVIGALPANAAPDPTMIFDLLKGSFPRVRLDEIKLALTPLLSVGVLASEYPMTRLSQKFEFCASHRLHDPALSPQENRTMYGKCNNPHGHGHNYEVQVTVGGAGPFDLPDLERVVAATVIERLDHKNLNIEVREFAQLIPTVENIARVIYGLLKPKLAGAMRLAAVTVWETPKTWCEYSE